MSWKNVSIGQACHWVVCVTVALPKRKKQGEQWWDFVNNRFTCINYVSIQQVKTLYISLNSKRLIRSFSILSTKKYVVLNLTFDSNTQMLSLSFSYFNHWDVCWAFLNGALPLGFWNPYPNCQTNAHSVFCSIIPFLLSFRNYTFSMNK